MENKMTDDQASLICEQIEAIGYGLSEIHFEMEFNNSSKGHMSRRDKFACAAMQALIPGTNCSNAHKIICERAYIFADQMIMESDHEN